MNLVKQATLPALVTGALLVGYALASILNNYIFQVITVSQNSMYPSLKNGQLLIVEKVSFGLITEQSYETKKLPDPRRASKTPIAIEPGLKRFKYPGHRSLKPGDIIIFVKPSFHPSTKSLQEETPFMVKRIAAVKENSFYVLGDNANHSTDSRTFGYIPERLVLGRVITAF